MTELTAKYLHSVLRYDWEIGEWFWLVDRTGGVRAGDRAGCLHHKGYIQIKIDRRFYRAHRLAFLYMIGSWPVDQVDHINRVRHDNRWRNLRDATGSENVRNQSKRIRKYSLPRGVFKRREKFQAKFCDIHLGRYETPEQAGEVYEAVARKHCGEFYHEP